jgi:hypothetical protein
VVLTGTTMVYALTLYLYEFEAHWVSILFALLAYLVTSFSRMHLGYTYPSDCIITLPIAILVILFTHLVRFLERLGSCIFDNKNYQADQVCYDPYGLDITRFNFWGQNPGYLAFLITLGFGSFLVLTAYPIEFWRKTPYLFANLFAIYIFHASMLSPSAQVRGLRREMRNEMSGNLKAIVMIMLATNLASNYVISNLMGRRTGHLLTAIIRSLTFIAIFSLSLTSMIIIRLVC